MGILFQRDNADIHITLSLKLLVDKKLFNLCISSNNFLSEINKSTLKSQTIIINN